jgi:Na+/melibiose symporter-like transporter
LSEFQLFVWFTTFAVLSRTALTFFHVPYLSLGAEMSLDYQERTQIVVLRTAFGMAASLLVIVAAWNFFFVETPDNASPQLERAPYFQYAILSAIVMTGMMMLSTWGTTSVIPHLTQTRPDHPPFSLKQVYRDLYDALKNPSFAALFWGSLIFMIYAGVHGALNMHVWTFFWELEARGIEYAQYGAIVGGLVGLAFLGLFHRWLDKRMTLIVGVVVSSIAGTLPVVFKMMGLMPEDQSVLIPILVTIAMLSTFGILHAGASGASMMGDIADEHELKHGRRQEGVYFGSHNFALKCTGAVGNLIAGFALDIVNFPVNSKPGEVPESVLFDFGMVYVVIVVMVVVALWIFWPYSMSRARHAEIRAILARREAEAGSDAPRVESSPG